MSLSSDALSVLETADTDVCTTDNIVMASCFDVNTVDKAVVTSLIRLNLRRGIELYDSACVIYCTTIPGGLLWRYRRKHHFIAHSGYSCNSPRPSINKRLHHETAWTPVYFLLWRMGSRFKVNNTLRYSVTMSPENGSATPRKTSGFVGWLMNK